MDPTLFCMAYPLGRDHRAQQARIDARLAKDIGAAESDTLQPTSTRIRFGSLRQRINTLFHAAWPVSPHSQPRMARLRGTPQ
jgi:hypothetical protein